MVLKKNRRFHCARHTFATFITLNNEVNIEAVIKIIYVHAPRYKITLDLKLLIKKPGDKKKLMLQLIVVY